MRDTFVRSLVSYAKEDNNIILMSGDLGYHVLDQFWDVMPERYYNAGIAEQNMAGVAAGLALAGKQVFIYSIGNFPTLRCLEQIRNDIAYHCANVTIVSVGGGFAYGQLGMSHHATEDIAVMRALPEMKVFTPGDVAETEAAVGVIVKQKGPCYLRLGKGGEKRLHETLSGAVPGKALRLKKGKNIAICCAGAILEEGLQAAELLEGEGISTAVYSFFTVKPIDAEWIASAAQTFDLIVTLEEHNVVGGFGSAVAEVFAELERPKARLRKMGLQDVYSSIVGSQKYLREQYGIDAASVVRKVKETISC